MHSHLSCGQIVMRPYLMRSHLIRPRLSRAHSFHAVTVMWSHLSYGHIFMRSLCHVIKFVTRSAGITRSLWSCDQICYTVKVFMQSLCSCDQICHTVAFFMLSPFSCQVASLGRPLSWCLRRQWISVAIPKCCPGLEPMSSLRSLRLPVASRPL